MVYVGLEIDIVLNGGGFQVLRWDFEFTVLNDGASIRKNK